MIQLKIRLLGVKQQSAIHRIFYNDDALKLFARKAAALIVPFKEKCAFSFLPKTSHKNNVIHFALQKNILSFYLSYVISWVLKLNKMTKGLHPKLNLTY